MSNDVKKEFQSCMTTGIIGLLLVVSIVGGAHYLSEAQKKESKENKPAQKISTQKTATKTAQYYFPQKDR